MPHPLVDQLRFTRTEFIRGVSHVSDEDGRRRFLPMNCLAWNVGHLAWQEQRTFLYYGQGRLLLPEIDREFTYGAPASTPSLKGMVEAWSAITQAAEPWLDVATSELLAKNVANPKGSCSARPTATCSSGLFTTTGTTPARTRPSANCWGTSGCRCLWATSIVRRPIGRSN